MLSGSPDGLPTLLPGQGYSLLTQDGGAYFPNYGDWLRVNVVEADGVAQNVVFTVSGTAIID